MDPHHARLRQLVVAKRAPAFDASLPVPPLDAALNPFQAQAIDRALRAQNYALILGTPGSGKTTVVAHLVRELHRRGQSVLITGFTHASVDTLLCKLLQLRVPFMRLAPSKRSVHSDVAPFVVSADDVESVAQLRVALETPLVVGATCLAIKHGMFERRELFDVCIVDEGGRCLHLRVVCSICSAASQITLPAILGPLTCARRFVLVGDHYQLPPLGAVGGGEERALAHIRRSAQCGCPRGRLGREPVLQPVPSPPFGAPSCARGPRHLTSCSRRPL